MVLLCFLLVGVASVEFTFRELWQHVLVAVFFSVFGLTEKNCPYKRKDLFGIVCLPKLNNVKPKRYEREA